MAVPQRILLTGGSGFIGRALAPALAARGHAVVAPMRADVGEIGPDTDWSRWLEGVDTAVHCAGLAHQRRSADDLMRVNAEGTARLADQASRAGVTRFILASSIKAAADATHGRALTESDPQAPGSTYGRSKLEAERAVIALQPLRAIVLRLPLVHGPDARANFALLLKLAASPPSLPFAGSRNRRSIIARTSLMDAVLAVLSLPQAPGGAFYVADQPALSTGEMIASLREGLGRSPGLFDGGALPRLGPRVLTEDFEIDDAKFRAAFPYQGQDARAALAATARAWKTHAR